MCNWSYFIGEEVDFDLNIIRNGTTEKFFITDIIWDITFLNDSEVLEKKEFYEVLQTYNSNLL